MTREGDDDMRRNDGVRKMTREGDDEGSSDRR
jgi:hypothetical protein